MRRRQGGPWRRFSFRGPWGPLSRGRLNQTALAREIPGSGKQAPMTNPIIAEIAVRSLKRTDGVADAANPLLLGQTATVHEQGSLIVRESATP